MTLTGTRHYLRYVYVTHLLNSGYLSNIILRRASCTLIYSYFSEMSKCVKRKAVMGTMTQHERTLVFNLPDAIISLMLGISTEYGPRRSTITNLMESRGVNVHYDPGQSGDVRCRVVKYVSGVFINTLPVRLCQTTKQQTLPQTLSMPTSSNNASRF